MRRSFTYAKSCQFSVNLRHDRYIQYGTTQSVGDGKVILLKSLSCSTLSLLRVNNKIYKICWRDYKKTCLISISHLAWHAHGLFQSSLIERFGMFWMQPSKINDRFISRIEDFERGKNNKTKTKNRCNKWIHFPVTKLYFSLRLFLVDWCSLRV